jgi:hypothetical protein
MIHGENYVIHGKLRDSRKTVIHGKLRDSRKSEVEGNQVASGIM